jgi:hypothetical protein
MTQRAIKLASDLGVLGTNVFFREGWVPYLERVNYLCDADIGISLHRDHIETRLSFRTRVVDLLWAGLPIISTGGDSLSEVISRSRAGIIVDDGDLPAVIKALRALGLDPKRRSRMREQARLLAASYTWQRVATPLVTYCRDPWHAADAHRPGIVHPRMRRWPVLYRRLLQVIQRGGVRGVARGGREWLAGLKEKAGAGVGRTDQGSLRPGDGTSLH